MLYEKGSFVRPQVKIYQRGKLKIVLNHNLLCEKANIINDIYVNTLRRRSYSKILFGIHHLTTYTIIEREIKAITNHQPTYGCKKRGENAMSVRKV